MEFDQSEGGEGLFKRIRHKILGPPRNIQDSSIFHKISLIPFLAWVGLGADGLSSSAYGPEEAFKALGQHSYLAIFLAVGTALTVFIISYAYSHIIEHFPAGGGGYVVATHTLGEKAGVVSGASLLVDYMLTITISIASAGDALFSFLPMALHPYKLPFEFFLILLLIILNLRGVKESIMILAPIFLTFIVTHALMLGYGILSHLGDVGPIARELSADFQQGLTALGGMGMLLLFFHAYSLGAGTYTGIEAVSNGLQIMREPKVHTAKRTMVYMSTSLALTAGGILVCYLLLKIRPVAGQTLNAVLAGNIFGPWTFGHWIAFVTILSEGALLIVAAQAGFIDGPRVMANMAVDSWFPHRFANLSERLTMHNGILLMGGGALLLLLNTRGAVSTLVIMYAINVFITFSLSELGMSRFVVKNRRREKEWKKHVSIYMTGLILCLIILTITILEKFASGGWVTLLITSGVIALCFTIRHHYESVRKRMRELDDMLLNIPTLGPKNQEPVNPQNMTAINLVTNFNGFGVHTLLSMVQNFPNFYKNIIFVSVGVVDSGSFKGKEEVEGMRESTRDALLKYVDLARRLGFPADYRFDVGTEVVESVTSLCESIVEDFPKSTVFTGQLIFPRVHIFHKLLHNETAYAIQRHLQWRGIPTMILPIRVRS